MMFVETIALFAALVSLLGTAAAAKDARHPVRRALSGALSGAAALGAVNLMAGYTGITIALNYATAFMAVVLGAPGVVTMLLLRAMLLLG